MEIHLSDDTTGRHYTSRWLVVLTSCLCVCDHTIVESCVNQTWWKHNELLFEIPFIIYCFLFSLIWLHFLYAVYIRDTVLSEFFSNSVTRFNLFIDFSTKMSSVSSLCSKILVVNIILVTFFAISDIQAAFKHDVTPSCPASEDVCNIELRVNYIMSMMSYNWSAFQGFPVDYNNGTFYKKISKSVGSTTHVCDQIPLTEDGKRTKSKYWYDRRR